MKRLGEFLFVTMLGYAVMELYLLLRPVDLTEQMEAFLDSAHGRFESFYADWRADRDAAAHPYRGAPIGD